MSDYLFPIPVYHEDLRVLPLDVFPAAFIDLLACSAVGQYRRVCNPEVCCGSICQRPANPCIVDIDFCVKGNGRYEIVPDLTAYSLDTTDGINGTWHVLQPLSTDPSHCGADFTVQGERNLRFVADMCDHVSSFYSEERICFRITVQEYQASTGTFGDYDDQLNASTPSTEEPDDPFVAPQGGCRQQFYGPRLPRA